MRLGSCGNPKYIQYTSPYEWSPNVGQNLPSFAPRRPECTNVAAVGEVKGPNYHRGKPKARREVVPEQKGG